MGRSLTFVNDKGEYERLGDMNEAEYKTLRKLKVFRLQYHDKETDECGLFVHRDNLQDAAQALCNAEPFDAALTLLLFHIATRTKGGDFLLW